MIYKAWILPFTQDDSAGLMPRVAGHCASVPVQLETTPPPCKYSEETDCVGRAPRPPSEALRRTVIPTGEHALSELRVKRGGVERGPSVSYPKQMCFAGEAVEARTHGKPQRALP